MSALVLSLLACSKREELPLWPLEAIPDENNFCIEAQRVVSRTEHPVTSIVHGSYEAFVKSKAIIEGPTIQQYTWYDGDTPKMISCKLKSADHLNEVFGRDTAGPDRPCQDMNRAVYRLLREVVTDTPYSVVIFDVDEGVPEQEQPGMTGPAWLAPFVPAYDGNPGNLHIRSKGFVVDWKDPQYANAPPQFRGIHYCHFLAPSYLAELISGTVSPGESYGRAPDLANFASGPPGE